MIQIAIDGPAGSGKSTISKIISKKMNISYLDTGAMYRVVTLKLMNEDISFDNQDAIKKILDTITIDIDENNNVYLDGQNVTKAIRKPRINKNVSKVASLKIVRQKMVKIQQAIAKGKSVIMDGRDIGTHVLPDADYKIYLNASVEERSRRRYEEIKDDHEDLTFEEVYEDIQQRDEKDMNRTFAPLQKADDAIEIDTTDLSIDAVVNKIISIIGD